MFLPLLLMVGIGGAATLLYGLASLSRSSICCTSSELRESAGAGGIQVRIEW